MGTEHGQTLRIKSDPHQCGNLFGCGETKGTGVFREDIAEATFTRKAADRLLHNDGVQQENLDAYLTFRGRSRRSLLRDSGFLGALAAIGTCFTKLEGAKDVTRANGTITLNQKDSDDNEGKVHTVESNRETVHLGVFDTTVTPILTIDSGDIVSYPNTWSHFMNQLQPGVPVEKAARNAIKFLATRAGLTELDAYALCSIAVSFRVTQVVDIVRGVHALIPKNLFANQLRRQLAVV